MNFIHTLFLLFCVCKDLAIGMMPELKKNVLNFEYGVNFKYEGMLLHSFDRFCVVTKIEIPKLEDVRFTTFSFDLTCKHLNISNHYMQRYIKHCKRIAPYIEFTTHKRQRRGIIATALGSIFMWCNQFGI